MSTPTTHIIWKVPTAKQRSQFSIGRNTLIAHVDKVTLVDNTNQLELELDMIATNAYIEFVYQSDEALDFFASFVKEVTSLAEAQTQAEAIYRSYLHGDKLIRAGFELQF